MLQIPVEKNTEYEIFCKGCQVSICYLSGCENILDEGICYLEQDENGRFIKMQESDWYDSPIREAYHFSPWKNWINDPNGLCWFQGYFHMFYQFNPHSQKWSHMYWGHAASRDLIHWTHLPVVLEPQEELLEHPEELEGGAFSGCAVAQEDEVVFYLTRSREPRAEGGEMLQQQWRMKSSDMLHFTKEELVIGKRPAGASPDFRDPKVTRADGRWVMALGSALEGKASILKYESGDMENWEYTGPLLVEEEEGIRCMECPDFMELDGKYLAVGALMCHHDPFGRYQMSRYYVGDFKEGIFTEENRGWFDFGSNCYAMQSFEHAGRRIGIGWISDFYGEHQEAENGAYVSIYMFRQFFLDISDELLEAASIDGCGPIRTFFQVVMPISGTVYATIFILDFVAHWNDFMWPLLVVTGEEKRTIQLAIQTFFGSKPINYGPIMASLTISAIPMLLMFIFLQKYYVEGIASTGIKG